MNGTNGLIVRFMLGIAAPLAVVVLFVVLPMAVAALMLFRWVGVLLAIFIMVRVGFLPGAFRLFKRHVGMKEYGIEPPVCGRCGYDLRASPDNCPECGEPVDRVDGTIVRYLITLRRRDAIEGSVGRER